MNDNDKELKIVRKNQWMKNAGMKTGTETLIITEQSQSLPTKTIRQTF